MATYKPGVNTIRKAGDVLLKGDITLTGGTNVTLTQTGQDISIAAAGGGGGTNATNLTATLSATNTIINSDTGTDATIPAVDATNAGVMTPTMKTKLDGIATSATTNDTDANLKARANHTGTQLAATISDFSTAADARITAATGVSVQGYSANTTTLGNTTTGTGSIVRATSPALVTPTGIVKGDVGLGNVDNTSDATKNSATATLTNKTLTSPVINSPTGIVKADVGLGNVDNTSDATERAAVATLTNKNLTSTTNIFPDGSLVQEVTTTFSAVATGTTVIPVDDTIPQITEGTEFMTQAITPKSATNKLVIEVNALLANTAAAAYIAGALFQDATANAVAATVERAVSASDPFIFTLMYTMTAGTTSATTFRFRAGASAAGTTTFNGQAGARFFGAIAKSSITVREIKA